VGGKSKSSEMLAVDLYIKGMGYQVFSIISELLGRLCCSERLVVIGVRFTL
jgi:hypothetical protein